MAPARRSLQRSISRPLPRWLPVSLVLVVLAIHAAALTTVILQLRAQLRQQIIGRDAQVLHEIAGLNLPDPAEDALLPGIEAGEEGTDADVLALLKEERLKELINRSRRVLGARLFNRHGDLILWLPRELVEEALPPSDVAAALAGRPTSHYEGQVPRGRLFAGVADRTNTLALLEVTVPLRGGPLNGIIGLVQLVLDGESAQQEFAALDRHLLAQGATLFVAGSVLIGVTLGWAFGRLARADRLLRERTQRLLKANAELALAARTSAVGAVTAHLIHGLKNPLAGLRQFVNDRQHEPVAAPTSNWDEAIDSAQRMHQLVQDAVRVLQEDTAGGRYELTPSELMEVLAGKVAPRLHAAGVQLQSSVAGEATLDNRTANLVILILENLLANAVEASPRGGAIHFQGRCEGRDLVFEVSDQGSGIADAERDGLFKPLQSRKPGGSGIGLAISRQLASHLGAELSLGATGPQGSVFSLRVPLPAPVEG